MAKITFQDVKPELLKALQAKAELPPYKNFEVNLLLIDGFIAQPIQPVIGNDAGFVIGGSSLPMVMAVGSTTGQIYYFPIKALLPKIEF